jgi:hypothetical protein
MFNWFTSLFSTPSLYSPSDELDAMSYRSNPCDCKFPAFGRWVEVSRSETDLYISGADIPCGLRTELRQERTCAQCGYIQVDIQRDTVLS